MTVLDLSNYDEGAMDVACMKAAGVTGVILGCQRNGIARTMADTLVAGDLPIIGVYAYLYFDFDVLAETQKAIDIAKDYGVTRVWLDCEDTSHTRTPAQVVQSIREAVSLIEGAT